MMRAPARNTFCNHYFSLVSISTALQVHATKTDRSRKENEGFSIWCHCNAAAFILRACIFNRWPIPIDAFVAPTATRPYFRHGPRPPVTTPRPHLEDCNASGANEVSAVHKSPRGCLQIRQTPDRTSPASPPAYLPCPSLRFRSPFAAHR